VKALQTKNHISQIIKYSNFTTLFPDHFLKYQLHLLMSKKSLFNSFFVSKQIKHSKANLNEALQQSGRSALKDFIGKRPQL